MVHPYIILVTTAKTGGGVLFSGRCPFLASPQNWQIWGMGSPHMRSKVLLMHRFILHMMAFRLEMPFKLAVWSTPTRLCWTMEQARMAKHWSFEIFSEVVTTLLILLWLSARQFLFLLFHLNSATSHFFLLSSHNQIHKYTHWLCG